MVPTCSGSFPSAPSNVSADDVCLRWFQMASFMPAMASYRDCLMPYDLVPTYTEWIRRALDHRMRLMPFFRTALFESTQNGSPMIRQQEKYCINYEYLVNNY